MGEAEEKEAYRQKAAELSKDLRVFEWQSLVSDAEHKHDRWVECSDSVNKQMESLSIKEKTDAQTIDGYSCTIRRLSEDTGTMEIYSMLFFMSSEVRPMRRIEKLNTEILKREQAKLNEKRKELDEKEQEFREMHEKVFVTGDVQS